MTDKELDDLFTQSFTRHEMPVPPDMWQRVNPEKEEKRRGLFWWWTGLGVAALFLLVGGIIHFSSSSLKPKAVTASLSASQKRVAVNTQQSGLKPAQPQAAGKETPDEKKVSSVLPLHEKTKGTVKQDQSVISIHKRNAADSYSSSRQLSATSGKYFSLINKDKKDTPVNPVNANGENNQAVTGNNTMVPEEKIAGNKQKEDSAQTATSSIATAEIASAATPVHVKKIHGEKTAGVELMVSGYGNDRDVYDSRKIPSNTIVSLGAVNHKPETSIQSFSINLRVDKPLTKNISLKTGLQFMQVHQRVTYNQEMVSQMPIVNSLGITNDTMISARIRSEEPVVKSVYNSISVPLLLQYYTNGAKMNFGASAGVLLNVISWYKGKVPDADYQKILSAGNAFKHNTGASLYLSLRAAKHVGSYQLFAEPNIQYTLSSVTRNSAGFKQRMAAYGIGIGIRKQIGK